MTLTPEEQARKTIDEALHNAGWDVQDVSHVNVHAAQGVAIREFPLKAGYGTADYLLYVNGKAAGALEAKKEGTTLSGVEIQTEKYSEGVLPSLPAHVRPLPFLYQSTGVETFFTNRLDPDPRSRRLFHFHRPEILAEWLQAEPQAPGKPSTFRSRLQHLPPLLSAGLWAAQRTAVMNLETSFADDRPRALIQMATGSGKTFTAITAIYRLIKYARVHRVLFLVDRRNLGKQALQEFQQYTTPDDGRKFTELYNVQHLASNTIDPIANVVITTIQRLYAMLRGDAELDPMLEEGSQFSTPAQLIQEPVGVVYNPRIPVEFFDCLFVDECHRSIYSLWRQVLEYFDAHIVGLTATPGKHTFGFFRRNLVMEYDHPRAVADGVNVDFEVYRIRTAITERGATIEAGPLTVVGKRDRDTRALRWEKPDEDITYSAKELDRSVVATDQIQTVIETFKDKLFAELFPGRTEVPKTLIYAKDDSHADDIVRIVREVFGKGNDFAQKITYRTGTARIVERVTGPDGTTVEQVTYKSTGVKPDDLLSAFRNGYNPRIVVTVDMLATGTDIRPLEIVMFMREVKSRSFFEQMKGRGVRVIDTTSNKQLNFLQHVKSLLEINGRAAVVVPDNVLFEGGVGETVRRRLLHECDVHTLLRLPTEIFYAQGVKANVLFFDRKRASETPWTQHLWIYDLRTNTHFTLKTNPLQRADLDEFVTCFNAENRHDRTPTWSDQQPQGRWRIFSYEELMHRDKCNLDIFWLKDESLEDSANLPEPDVIIVDIIEDLRTALEQLEEIAGDVSVAG